MKDKAAQTALFYDTFPDALIGAVHALGGFKKVGGDLRPEMLAEAAGRWLSDCLNPETRAKLELDQLMYIIRAARQANHHALMNYMCEHSGYGNPQPVEPEDEKAKLMRDFIEATKEATRNVERMEALTRAPLRAAA